MKKLNSVIYKDKIQKCYKTQNTIASELCACVETLISSMDIYSEETKGKEFEKPKHREENNNNIKENNIKENQINNEKKVIDENKKEMDENDKKMNNNIKEENKINNNDNINEGNNRINIFDEKDEDFNLIKNSNEK